MKLRYSVMLKSTLLGLLFISSLYPATQDTVWIYSAKMDTTLPAIVIVPESASHWKDQRFPAVYLLHGWSGNYTNWPSKVDLMAYAEQFHLVIVCPEGGYAGWYLNSPVDPRSQFDTFISQDVVRYVDTHYPVIPQFKGRAICGLSMGGHGALYLLIRHPHVFIAASSMSGVLRLGASTVRSSIAHLLGTYEEHKERWHQYSVINLLNRLQNYHRFLLIDCGVADPFIAVNREAHQQLLLMNYPHTYIERPGGHTWDYWKRFLPYHLLFFQQIFKQYLSGK